MKIVELQPIDAFYSILVENRRIMKTFIEILL